MSKSTPVLFGKTMNCVRRSRPIQLFGKPICVATAPYRGVTLDTRLNRSAHINPVGRKAAQTLDILFSLLDKMTGLSIRNVVLFYKQLICPMMDYACPICRLAALTHINKLEVLQSKFLCNATNAPWYISNRQIHENLGVPFFAHHMRALTEL
jgi:hypothetical protein